MSTLKEKCENCWVESVDENSVCYAGKHRIHYCSLHDAATQMQTALTLAELYLYRTPLEGSIDAHQVVVQAIATAKGEKNEKEKS